MIPLALSAPEWAQLAAPFLATLAAGASWASVSLSRRQFKVGMQPRLTGYWRDLDGGGVRLRIENTGSGIALEPSFCVYGEDRKASGRLLESGPLRPGRWAEVDLNVPHRADGSDGTGVMVCLDVNGRWHAWSWDGRHRLLRDGLWGSPEEIDLNTVLAKLYPETANWRFERTAYTRARRTSSADQE